MQTITSPGVGQRIKNIRTARGLTRPYLFQKYGVSTTSVYIYEEKNKPITRKFLLKILNIFKNEGIDVSEEWILFGTGKEPKIYYDQSLPQNDFLESVYKVHEEIDNLKYAEIFKQLNPEFLTYLIEDEETLLNVLPSGSLLLATNVPIQKLSNVCNRLLIFKLTNKTTILRTINYVGKAGLLLFKIENNSFVPDTILDTSKILKAGKVTCILNT